MKIRKKMRERFLVLALVLVLVMGCALTVCAEAAPVPKAGQKTVTRWEKLLDQYQNKKNTNRLIFVKYQGGTRATLVMYKKVASKKKSRWEKILSCSAFVGQNGIDKEREGDRRTPTGTYWITSAFGIKKNPGTKVPYTKVNRYIYWSAEKATYNKMIDVRDLGRSWMAGEHLIDYRPQYHYALVVGYNQTCVYQKGSAIFLHVKGNYPYTGGCIAVSEGNMKKIMKNATKKTRICIYPYR